MLQANRASETALAGAPNCSNPNSPVCVSNRHEAEQTGPQQPSKLLLWRWTGAEFECESSLTLLSIKAVVTEVID